MTIQLDSHGLSGGTPTVTLSVSTTNSGGFIFVYASGPLSALTRSDGGTAFTLRAQVVGGVKPLDWWVAPIGAAALSSVTVTATTSSSIYVGFMCVTDSANAALALDTGGPQTANGTGVAASLTTAKAPNFLVAYESSDVSNDAFSSPWTGIDGANYGGAGYQGQNAANATFTVNTLQTGTGNHNSNVIDAVDLAATLPPFGWYSPLPERVPKPAPFTGAGPAMTMQPPPAQNVIIPVFDPNFPTIVRRDRSVS